MSTNDTTATMRAVLERINELGQQLRAEMKELGQQLRTEISELGQRLDSKIDAVHAELKEFRKETDRNFGRYNRQFDHTSGEILRVKATTQEIEDRVEKLEEKAS